MGEKFVCPKCGSDNIQSCQVIYQNGTISHSYTSTNGDNTVNTSGVESTSLAQSVAPPPKKDEPYMGVLGCLGVAVVFYWWGWPVASIICVLAAIGNAISIKEAMDYNEKQWPKEYKAWQHSYLCHRCGHYFQLD
jgi:transcription elongation factor Elf1